MMKAPAYAISIIVIIAAATAIWFLQNLDKTPEENTTIIDTPQESVVEPQRPPTSEDRQNSMGPNSVENLITTETSTSEETPTILENTEEPEIEVKPPQVQGGNDKSILPRLEQSDASFIDYINGLSGLPIEMRLVKDHLIRKFVRAINAIEEGTLVNKYRPVLEPSQPFVSEKEGQHYTLSEKNFDRYSADITMLEDIGADSIVATYKHYYPLMEEAYQELGVDKGKLSQVIIRALDQIIDSPEVSGPIILARTSVMYKFHDPKLEKRSDIQKLMIRVGPKNRGRLQQLASEIKSKLETGDD